MAKENNLGAPNNKRTISWTQLKATAPAPAPRVGWPLVPRAPAGGRPRASRP
jgi:hypothetical protein